MRMNKKRDKRDYVNENTFKHDEIMMTIWNHI